MSRNSIEIIILYMDGFLIAAIALTMLWLHPALQADYHYLAVIALHACLYLLIAPRLGLHELKNIVQPYQSSRRLLGLLLLIFVTLVVLAVAFKLSESFSRIWLFGWQALLPPALLANRFLLKLFLSKSSVRTKVAILGAGPQGQKLLDHLNHMESLEVTGVFDDRINTSRIDISPHYIKGDSETLLSFVGNNQCEKVLVAMPWSAEERITEIIEKLRVLPIDVALAPDLVSLRYPMRFSSELGLPVFDLTLKPLGDFESFFKRFADFTIALSALVLLSPLFLIIIIAIKLDSKGPVFFVQKRYGFNRQPLYIYKFRTMKAELTDADGETLTTKNDTRVTRTGRFLRQSSMDELPQLLNVVMGGMSIVGPRPHATKAKAGDTLYQEAVSNYALRYRVKPGIIGWAQVNGWRGETDTQEKLARRVEHDLFYIENWSPLFDFMIIFRTVWVCILGRNAY